MTLVGEHNSHPGLKVCLGLILLPIHLYISKNAIFVFVYLVLEKYIYFFIYYLYFGQLFNYSPMNFEVAIHIIALHRLYSVKLGDMTLDKENGFRYP